MFIGKIKEVIVRERDIIINYISNEFPNSSGCSIIIQKDELLGFPFVGQPIQVETDNTNTVTRVIVNNKIILQR